MKNTIALITLIACTTTYANDTKIAAAKKPVELKLGSMAPAFTAIDQDGTPWALKAHTGKKHLVVYFYPAAMTGGCTKQACSYRDYVKTAAPDGITIVGISGDTPENLKHFQQAESLNFTLLSDPDGSIAKAFGVPVKTGDKSITRTVNGKEVELSRSTTTARWTFIIDPSGKLVYKDAKVKAAADLENVLAFLKQEKK